MTGHRYPCTAESPELLQPNGPVAGALGNHRHACIHDRDASPGQPMAEHECECGMTWRATSLEPAPVDLSWITTEPESRPWRWLEWTELVAMIALFGTAGL